MACKPLPTIEETAQAKLCPNCGAAVERKSARGPRPTFCGKACQTATTSRNIARGAVIVTMAQAWRANRGSGDVAKAAFQELCAILDGFNAEDSKAGRPRADLHAAKLLAGGYRYIDRKRK